MNSSKYGNSPLETMKSSEGERGREREFRIVQSIASGDITANQSTGSF